MADLPDHPVTRQEMYLSRLAGENTTLPDEPLTREEMYLEGDIERVEKLQTDLEELKNNPDVADIVPTYAALQQYDTSKLTDKAIIRVLADETHDGQSTYYRYSTSAHEFTFLGTAGDYYTKAQTDAALALKADKATTYTKTEVDTALAGKQDVLTAGANVQINGNTISATDTTYTAGNGLTLTGTEFSADTAVLATQTDLASKQNTLTAGNNITISNDTISATDTTYSVFTGTDGTAAGAAGLVPAPATTDAGKFLKADGTWDAAGSIYTAGTDIDISNGVISATNTGKAKVLTTADYNDNPDNPQCVDVTKLSAGWYIRSSSFVKIYWGSYGGTPFTGCDLFYYTGGTNGYALTFRLDSYPDIKVTSKQNPGFMNDGYATFLKRQDTTDNLTSTYTAFPLSANQGKVLNDKIEGRIIQNAGAPTTSTVGTVGMLLEDTTNGKLYICTDSTDPYVWEGVSTGSGAATINSTDWSNLWQ